MLFSYRLVLITLLPFIMLLLRFYILRKRNIPYKLFTEALRNENSGHFEAAALAYETALHEVNKIKFHNNNFKNSIIEKLKVLNTIIEYKNSLHITR